MEESQSKTLPVTAQRGNCNIQQFLVQLNCDFVATEMYKQ